MKIKISFRKPKIKAIMKIKHNIIYASDRVGQLEKIICGKKIMQTDKLYL